ncbi:ATP-binding protein [Acinetobacter radioresistens]|uniref:ATP-binding protein n=1 Tax=Acinetobacter radioresistens TaxID=40216 RepID=UPI0009465415|nr:ATP-binding protein [Acinetobacter radioresistens]
MKAKRKYKTPRFMVQLIIMLSLLNIGITLLSFLIGYVVYEWATAYQMIEEYEISSGFSIIPLDFLWIFLVLLTGLVLSTIIAFKYAKIYSQPIRQMAHVAQQIQQGNLSMRVEEHHQQTPHELRDLLQNFNDMAHQLETAVNNSSFWNAAIAHELRTPVTILKGRLQGIVDGVFEADHAMHVNLLHQIQGLSYLVEDLRTLSLIEHQKLRLDWQDTTLEDSIYKCVNMFQSRFEAKQLIIALDLCHHSIKCDIRRLEQVMIALFSNALRYSNPGKLMLTTTVSGDEWIFTFEDEGPGIAPEHIEHLFQPFYRLEDSRSRADGGTGLGLAVIAAIVEAHQGSINYCKSLRLGGSCFRMRLNANPHIQDGDAI